MRFNEDELYEMERLAKSAGFQPPEVIIPLVKHIPALVAHVRQLAGERDSLKAKVDTLLDCPEARYDSARGRYDSASSNETIALKEAQLASLRGNLKNAEAAYEWALGQRDEALKLAQRLVRLMEHNLVGEPYCGEFPPAGCPVCGPCELLDGHEGAHRHAGAEWGEP